jgi:hypothetical protein
MQGSICFDFLNLDLGGFEGLGGEEGREMINDRRGMIDEGF